MHTHARQALRAVACAGLCRIGWSTKAASLELGTDKQSFGYGGTAKKSHARQFDTYGATYGQGDVIGCLLNIANGEIAFTKNGEDLGVAFNLPQHMRGGCAFYPSVCLKNSEIDLNFGSKPFHSLPQ
eukprot:3712432-Pyramimonas_sp.AAC.1